MIRLLFIIVISISCSLGYVKAQSSFSSGRVQNVEHNSNSSFGRGMNYLNFSGGLGVKGGFTAGLSYERGVLSMGEYASMGVGAMVMYNSYMDKDIFSGYGVGVDAESEDLVFAITYDLHYTPSKYVDLYSGIQLGGQGGYARATASGYGESVTASEEYYSVFYGFRAGARFFFSDYIGFNIEGGYSVYYLSGGLTIRF